MPRAHPPGVRAQVVDAVRDRLAGRAGREVADIHPLRVARGRHPAPPLAILPLSRRPPRRPAGRRPGARAPGRRCSGTGRPGPGAGCPRRPWRFPAGCSPRPPTRRRRAEQACPAAVSVPARFRVDRHVHCSGDSGSPRDSGSTSAMSAGPSPGSVSDSFLRPPPGARTRGSGPPAASRTPRLHRVRVHAGRRRHRLDAAAAQLQRLRPEQQPTLPLIQMRPQYPVQPRHPLPAGLAVPVVVRHTTKGRPSGRKNLGYFVAHAYALGARRRNKSGTCVRSGFRSAGRSR